MPSKTPKRMVIMLLVVIVLLGALVAFNFVKNMMIQKYMASMGQSAQTVTAMVAANQTWQPSVAAIGTVRAVRGADLALDASGIVDQVAVQSGDDVKAGDVLLKLRADDNTAALAQARASLALAQITFERFKKQLAVKAVARADYDKAAANLKVAQASVAQLAAVLDKKTLRAPFDGRVGIITVNPGAYVNAGTSIITLQQLDPVYIDFTLPQKQLDLVHLGGAVHAKFDGISQRDFVGKVTASDPKLDPATRNVRIEAEFQNPDGTLLPGMFAHIDVDSGAAQQFLTLPSTAIAYNPYGATVFVVHKGAGKDKDGKPVDTVQQTFITAGATRGDQVAIVKGIKAGDLVVTSGQLKLKNGTPVVIDNSVVPANDPHPTVVEQ